MDPNGPIGAFLEVDIDVPDSLHDKLAEFSILPEQVVHAPSPFVKVPEVSSKEPKLMATLEPKRN